MKKKLGYKIKSCKPNLFQKLMYKLKKHPSPMFEGKGYDWMLMDELAHMANNSTIDRWNSIKNKIHGR